MASPQTENGYTKIANEILEQIVKVPLNGTQLRIVTVVWRYTYGFNRKEHDISINFIANALNLKNTQYKQVSRELKRLIDIGVLVEITKPDKNKARRISFNKNYDVWTTKSSGLIKPEDKIDQREGAKKTIETLDELVPKEIKDKENIKTLDYQGFFESIWKLYPKKKGKGQVSETQKKKLYKIGIEEMTRAIERYKKEKTDTEMQFWQNGSTYFNSGYVDYLDENYTEIEEPRTRGW